MAISSTYVGKSECGEEKVSVESVRSQELIVTEFLGDVEKLQESLEGGLRGTAI